MVVCLSQSRSGHGSRRKRAFADGGQPSRHEEPRSATRFDEFRRTACHAGGRAFTFPVATEHRVDRFEEALRIIRPLLDGKSVSFAGRFHRVREAVLLPEPNLLAVAASGANPSSVAAACSGSRLRMSGSRRCWQEVGQSPRGHESDPGREPPEASESVRARSVTPRRRQRALRPRIRVGLRAGNAPRWESA
jgi:hypothetical protein